MYRLRAGVILAWAHDTDSATENNHHAFGVKWVKTWGKSPRLHAVMRVAGKPCMLKCHVNPVSAAFAKASTVGVSGPFPTAVMLYWMGRQLDPFSNEGAR